MKTVCQAEDPGSVPEMAVGLASSRSIREARAAEINTQRELSVSISHGGKGDSTVVFNPGAKTRCSRVLLQNVTV